MCKEVSDLMAALSHPDHWQVIVGFNGSGKSTILKLAARIYDATEGTIRINGRNIRDLKLEDLRRSIAVLFQDYTLFPLSVRLTMMVSIITLLNKFPTRLRTTSPSVIPNMPLTLSSSTRQRASEVQTL